MGQCISIQTQINIQYLNYIINYVEKMDLEYKPKIERYDKSDIERFLKVMDVNFGILKQYINSSELRFIYTNSYEIKFMVLFEKIYNFIICYKDYIEKVDDIENKIFLPIKDAVLIFLKSLKDECQTTQNMPKQDMIVSAMNTMETTYDKCMRSSSYEELWDPYMRDGFSTKPY